MKQDGIESGRTSSSWSRVMTLSDCQASITLSAKELRKREAELLYEVRNGNKKWVAGKCWLMRYDYLERIIQRYGETVNSCLFKPPNSKVHPPQNQNYGAFFFGIGVPGIVRIHRIMCCKSSVLLVRSCLMSLQIKRWLSHLITFSEHFDVRCLLCTCASCGRGICMDGTSVSEWQHMPKYRIWDAMWSLNWKICSEWDTHRCIEMIWNGVNEGHLKPLARLCEASLDATFVGTKRGSHVRFP